MTTRTNAEHMAVAMYHLAYGYALGVLHAQPSGVSYGVRSEEEVAEFARAYREEFEGSTFTSQVAPAFGEWRTTGSIKQ